MTAADSISLIAEPDDEGKRLDRFIAERLDDISRNQVQILNTKGVVTVDGLIRPHSYRISDGETVVIASEAIEAVVNPAARVLEPQSIPLRVVFEDDDIVVVNKDAGMVVHPAYGNLDGTLVNALLGRGTQLAALGLPDRPGIVHRLDKDTSGVMVVAKTDAAYHHFVNEIKAGGFEKTYHGIAIGHLGVTEMFIDAPISRHSTDRQRMAVADGGRHARTNVLVVDRYGHFDYIRVSTETGRTHQIRVHLAHVGHPLLSDTVYGGRKRKGMANSAGSRDLVHKLFKIVTRHALHSSQLSFTHPTTQRRVTFTTALPADLRCALELLHREDRLEGGSD